MKRICWEWLNVIVQSAERRACRPQVCLILLTSTTSAGRGMQWRKWRTDSELGTRAATTGCRVKVLKIPLFTQRDETMLLTAASWDTAPAVESCWYWTSVENGLCCYMSHGIRQVLVTAVRGGGELNWGVIALEKKHKQAHVTLLTQGCSVRHLRHNQTITLSYTRPSTPERSGAKEEVGFR